MLRYREREDEKNSSTCLTQKFNEEGTVTKDVYLGNDENGQEALNGNNFIFQ